MNETTPEDPLLRRKRDEAWARRQTTAWPDATVPEWLREIALDPRDYDEGQPCFLQGTLGSGEWVSWNVDEDRISLDGDFTAQQLREIVAMMEAHA